MIPIKPESGFFHSLDIGCGLAHRGSVNCDIERPCQVLCDAHYLPFRNNGFMKSYLSHVIEHCKNPVKVLDEALRVSFFVEVRTPISHHPYGHFDKTHLWFFSSSWFSEYARARGLRIRGKLRFDTEQSFYWLAVEICVYLIKERIVHYEPAEN